jgi:hypothetical protein
MRYLTLIIALLSLIISCSEQKEKRSRVAPSTFKLDKDLYHFSERMINGDTIIFNAMMGVCESHCMERNLIFKINDSVLIQSVIEDIYPSGDSKTLPRVQYKFNANDTLNFENLLTSLSQDRTNLKNNGQFIYQTIYKQDTIEFVPKNLILVLDKIRYYEIIKARLYPNEKLFKPDIVLAEP